MAEVLKTILTQTSQLKVIQIVMVVMNTTKVFSDDRAAAVKEALVQRVVAKLLQLDLEKLLQFQTTPLLVKH
jgi:hypothetical protein